MTVSDIGRGFTDPDDRRNVVETWAPRLSADVAAVTGRRFVELVEELDDTLSPGDRTFLVAALNSHASATHQQVAPADS